MATFQDQTAQSISIGLSQNLHGFNPTNNSTGFAAGVASLSDATAVNTLQSILNQSIHSSQDFISAVHDIEKVFIRGNLTNTQVLSNLKQIAKETPNLKNTAVIMDKLKDVYKQDSKQLRTDINFLLKGLDRSLKQILSTNQKQLERQNINYIAKAFQKSMENYAVSGMGKHATVFYEKSTKKQMDTLVAIRKAISEGVPLKTVAGKGIFGDILKKELKDTAYLTTGHAANFIGGPGTTALTKSSIDLVKAIRGYMGKKNEGKIEDESNRLGMLKTVRDTSVNQVNLLEAKQQSALEEKEKGIQGRADVVNQGRENINIASNLAGLDASYVEDIISKLSDGSVEGVEQLIEKLRNIEPSETIDKASIDNTILSLSALSKGILDQNNVISQADSQLELFSEALRKSIDSVADIDLKLQEQLENYLSEEFKVLDKLVKSKYKNFTKDQQNALIEENRNALRQRSSEDLSIGKLGNTKDRIQNTLLMQGKSKLSEKDISLKYSRATEYTNKNIDRITKGSFISEPSIPEMQKIQIKLNEESNKIINNVTDFGNMEQSKVASTRSNATEVNTRDSTEVISKIDESSENLNENLEKILDRLVEVSGANKDVEIIDQLKKIKEVLSKSLGDKSLSDQIAQDLANTTLNIKSNSEGHYPPPVGGGNHR